MSNPSKSKGTEYENNVLRDLQDIWGMGVKRAQPNNPSNDFHGQPFPVEAKKRKTWLLKDWIRKIEKVSDRSTIPVEWAIFVSDYDQRLATSVPDVVIFPRDFAVELLESYYQDAE